MHNDAWRRTTEDHDAGAELALRVITAEYLYAYTVPSVILIVLSSIQANLRQSCLPSWCAVCPFLVIYLMHFLCCPIFIENSIHMI